jgi:exosortase/archaeosortase family protein
MGWAIRALIFLAVFTALSLSWNALRGTSAERWVVHDATVRPAAWIANQLTPGIQARAVDSSLRAPGGGLNILNGCEGLDALFLLVAAFAVAPLAWRWRVAGLAGGVIFVFALNQVRILALFYAFRSHPSAFQTLHGLVAPIGVILAVCGYFYAWLRYGAHSPTSPG